MHFDPDPLLTICSQFYKGSVTIDGDIGTQNTGNFLVSATQGT